MHSPTSTQRDAALQLQLRWFRRAPHAARLDCTLRFVHAWFGHLLASTEQSEPLPSYESCPPPLRGWYEAIGTANACLWRQNFLLPPSELLAQEEGDVTFYVENQWVYMFGFRAAGAEEDPELVEADFGTTGVRMSELILQALVLELAAWAAPARIGFAALDAIDLARFASVVPQVSASPWRVLGHESHFFASDRIAAVLELGSTSMLRLGLRSRHDLEALLPFAAAGSTNKLRAWMQQAPA